MAHVISGTFDTRREAEMAVERFVQGHGVDRDAIRIVPVSAENSAGVEVAGADAKLGEPTPPSGDEAALAGRIEVSLDRYETEVQTAREIFKEFKATDINVG